MIDTSAILSTLSDGAQAAIIVAIAYGLALVTVKAIRLAVNSYD